jgi:hypothetical protein
MHKTLRNRVGAPICDWFKAPMRGLGAMEASDEQGTIPRIVWVGQGVMI